MGFANTEIPIMERWVPRTEPDGLLLRRDRVLDLPDVGLAATDGSYRAHRVAIECEGSLVFGDGLRTSALGAQHLGFSAMSNRTAGRCRYRFCGQLLRAFNIGLGGAAAKIQHAIHKHHR